MRRMRGGTSEEHDRLILAVFGTPDRRQIDGLGGSDVLTNTFAAVGPSSHTSESPRFAPARPSKRSCTC
jgi:2-methylaconitate cis-trans-isomerase PrpF